jgi:hypothetical protein
VSGCVNPFIPWLLRRSITESSLQARLRTCSFCPVPEVISVGVQVVIFRDGKFLTLAEVFESLKMTG